MRWSIHVWGCASILATLTATWSCAADLGDELDADMDAGMRAPVSSEDRGDGTTVTRIDATDYETWVYFDLDTDQEVTTDAAADSLAWDLGFQRSNIQLNGGASGPGDTAVAFLPDTGFDSLARGPDTGYVTDQPDADGDGKPEYAMTTGEGRWFDYDVATHVLTPKPLVYVVRTTEGRHYKLAIEGYYDDAGTAAILGVRWGAVDAPAQVSPTARR